MEAELARVEVRVNDARARRLVHTAGTRATAERAKAELAARHANDAEREQQGTADEWLAAHRDATTKDERHRVVPDADVTDQTAPTVVDAHLSTPGAVGGPISAPMVVALEAAWAAIWEWHPEIPAAVIVLGAGSIGAAGGGLKLGHVAAMRWNDPRPDRPGRRYRPRGCGCRRCSSVVKDSRAARLSARDAVARGRTRARGCAGDQGHKQAGPLAYARFKALAEELGIEVTKDPRIGWSPTSIPAATRDLYDEVIAELGRALRLRALRRWRLAASRPGLLGGEVELVALGIGEGGEADPVLLDLLDDGGAQAEQPFALAGEVSGGEVGVHLVAVFGQVVGLLEDEERVLAAGADDDARELRGIGSAAEELRPERRQGLGAVQSKVIACSVMLMMVLRFSGRRVDLMIRSLPVPLSTSHEAVTNAIRDWLHEGTMERRRPSDDDMPSNWWLSKRRW